MNYIKRLHKIKQQFGYDDSLYSDPKLYDTDKFVNAGDPNKMVIYRSKHNETWRTVKLRVNPIDNSEDIELTDSEAEYLLSAVATKEEFEAGLMAFAAIKKAERDNGL